MADYWIDDDATGRRTRIRTVPLWSMLESETIGGLRHRYAREIASIRRARADRVVRALVEREAAA